MRVFDAQVPGRSLPICTTGVKGSADHVTIGEGKMKKILVVDDEPFILRALSFVLRKEGFVVAEACNGEEAMDRLRQQGSDLVILDVMMPRKNGYEVLQEIRKDSNLKDTYVIMLTAKGQESERELGMTLGVNEYITKPFSPMKVVERARAALNRHPLSST